MFHDPLLTKRSKTGNSSTNMLDPRGNFGFAFDNPEFSDRVLRIEVMKDSLDSESKGDNLEKEKGDETALSNDSKFSTVLKVTTLHINSLILAAKSPFFYKLFKNGMRESQQVEVTLRISISEEAALMDILKFMYEPTLRATTRLDLLSVLMVADKFEVSSCVKYCSVLLKEMPMTLESSLFLYLELPSSVFLSEEIQPLVDAAKQYLVTHYRDITKSEEEMMALPLPALEAILGSDGHLVNSDDDVFEFILKWARAHYPKLEERREIIAKRLTTLIVFRHMSCSKLKEVLICPDFDHEKVSKLVFEALFFKLDDPCAKASYAHRRIKVVQFEQPKPRCVVYFDIKKEDCENLFRTDKDLFSPEFPLGGRQFYLGARYIQELGHQFGLFLYTTKDSETCKFNFEFAVMKNSSKDYERKQFNNNTMKYSGLVFFYLSGIPWNEFISEESDYFINDILHIRVKLTLNITQD